jgi:GNAT superfamily N-acetyltransferase
VDKVKIHRCVGAKVWPIFAPHHYLNDGYFGHGAFVAVMENTLVGFSSYISYPSGTIKQRARREHRTVVLPDFQGMGLGVRLSECVGEIMLAEGFRYFSKTSHPRMGEYRNVSPSWKSTSKNGISRADQSKRDRWVAKTNKAYSHEYIGSSPSVYDKVMENIPLPEMELF